MNRCLRSKPISHNKGKGDVLFIKEIRNNIKQLNRSMQNIGKMIETSQNILNNSKLQTSVQSLDKNQIKVRNDCSYSRENEGQSNPLFKRRDDSFSKHRKNESYSLLEVTCLSKNGRKQQSNQDSNKSFHTNNHEPSELTLPHKIEKQTVYHFSPQKTNSSHSISTHKKALSIFNPQNGGKITIKSKHKRNFSMDNQKEIIKSTQTKSVKSNIKLRMGTQSKGLSNDSKAGMYPFKTQYKYQDEKTFIPSFINRSQKSIKQENLISKAQISIKLFSKQLQKHEEEKQLKEIIKDRSFIVEPPLLIKKKQTQARRVCVTESEESIKDKFIEKIAQYKFVENYLSKNEIWGIYDRLILQNIPELKWPIVIVDEVYKKIQKVQ